MNVIKHNYYCHQTIRIMDFLFSRYCSKCFAGINSFRFTTTLQDHCSSHFQIAWTTKWKNRVMNTGWLASEAKCLNEYYLRVIEFPFFLECEQVILHIAH